MTDVAAPHALYRFYDVRDRLLYVGITLDLGARWKHHSKNKTWWVDVARCTVEHFPTRDAVLAAESVAINAEKPRWNIVHNRGRLPRGTAIAWTGGQRLWEFDLRDGRNRRLEPLELYWELNWDSITDDFFVDEISPEELWAVWRQKSQPDANAEHLFGPGARRIRWYVGGGTCFEGAPFQEERNDPCAGSTFLDHYTWPVDPDTGSRLIWSKLAVIDRLWRPGRGDKGGFIQELTGWKPSPFQPFVNINTLEQMAGILTRRNR